MQEQQFKRYIKKVDKPRVHKVKNSLGVYDAYKWYRKNRPTGKEYIITESQYFAIIRKANELLRSILIDKGEIILPCRLGKLEVRKYPAIITTDGKKVKTNLPIDWDATLKLWYEDEECFKSKMLIHSNVPEIFRVSYDKSKANYNNKSFYQFSTNRELKLLLKKAIRTNPGFDAFLN